MGKVVFKNEDLNKKYEITGGDQHIESSRNKYAGPLSGIPSAEILDDMIKRESPLVGLKKKQDPPPPPPVDDPKKVK